MTGLHNVLAVGIAAVLAACGTSEKAQQGRKEAASQPGMGMDSPGGMHDMPGMGGDTGGMMGGGMMAEMGQHMQRMMGAGADSMRAMMPMHRQMTAKMLSRLNREMRDMNMTGDAGWTATGDSIRQDLVRMADMSGEELRAAMPAHRDRVMRLMEMHRDMMGNMNM